MFRRLSMGLTISLSVLFFGLSSPASAQMADLSPELLIESLPSDNPKYRRMILVSYLSAGQVTVTYKAYNRTEFRRVQNQPVDAGACINGSPTALRDILVFAKAEASLARSRKTPETTRFCIKNVAGWAAGNKDRYLDPIFTGLPISSITK